MDISSLKKPFQTWVPYQDEVELLIEYLPRDAMRQLSKQAVTLEFDVKSHQKLEKFDQELAEKLICQRVVKDWRGLTEGGEPYPCTPENVAYLVEKLSGFALFINRVCVDLQSLNEAEKRVTEKN